MSNQAKQLKTAITTKNKALQERDEAYKQLKQANAERDAALAKMGEAVASFQRFADAYGATPEEAANKLAQLWNNYREKESELQAGNNGLMQFEKRLDQESEALLALKADLEKREEALATKAEVLKDKENELAEIEASQEVAGLRRRLRAKSEENKSTVQKIRAERDSLHKECNRLTSELFSVTHRFNKTEDALTTLCERFNMKVVLDIYKGKPIWISNGESVEIPECGMILEFLDESVFVTRDNFGGANLVTFELFAQVINKDLMPQRWHIGLHEGNVTLFARGLYKVVGVPLIKPEAPEEGEEDAVVYSPISDPVEPTEEARNSQNKAGDCEDRGKGSEEEETGLQGTHTEQKKGNRLVGLLPISNNVRFHEVSILKEGKQPDPLCRILGSLPNEASQPQEASGSNEE